MEELRERSCTPRDGEWLDLVKERLVSQMIIECGQELPPEPMTCHIPGQRLYEMTGRRCVSLCLFRVGRCTGD